MLNSSFYGLLLNLSIFSISSYLGVNVGSPILWFGHLCYAMQLVVLIATILTYIKQNMQLNENLIHW